MDEDRAPRRPRRTGITIRVYEVAPTGKRRDVCRISAGYDRDVDLRTKAPIVWPDCACPRCREVTG